MALTDPEALAHAEVQPVTATTPRPGITVRSRRTAAVIGAGQAIAAVALTVVALTTASLPMWARSIAALAALVFAFCALRSIAHAVAGRPVDVGFGLSCAWLGILGVAAVLAPLLPLGEHENSAATIAVRPYLRPDLFSSHPLGTNQLGLDIFARTIWGARYSVGTAAVALLIGTVIGGLIGVVAGYFSGWTDRTIGVANNIALAFPPLVLLFVVAAIAGHSLIGVTFALSLLVIPGTVRYARANVLSYGQREHTYVAYLLGATRWQVLRREILPSVAISLVTITLLTLPLLIVAEASLSYLGLGVEPPAPTWGNMIAEGEGGVFEHHPHIVLIPGVVLFVTVFALSIIGQRARSWFDTREAKL